MPTSPGGGGRVTGTVKNANGTPLDMCISIFEIVNGNLRIKGNATSDASNDGIYAARNISRPGPVVVRFHHCQGDPIVYAAEWYENKGSGSAPISYQFRVRAGTSRSTT